MLVCVLAYHWWARKRRGQRDHQHGNHHAIIVGETEHIEAISEKIGNELANIATGVEGHAQYLCESLGQPEDVEQSAGSLWESVRRLRLLTEKITSFSKSRPPSLEPTDLQSLLVDLRQDLESHLESNLRVQLRFGSTLPLAMTERHALYSAIMFLIETVLALEAEAVTLILQASTHIDDGKDLLIRMEIQAQADENAKTTPGAAPGKPYLGYVAAQNLLESQAINLSLDHTPGLTTTANFALRTVERQAPKEVDKEPLPPQKKHGFGGVLVLEGDPSVRSVIARELKDSGRHIVACSDGVAARELFMATPERFELMILGSGARRPLSSDFVEEAFTTNPELKALVLAQKSGAQTIPKQFQNRQIELLKPFSIRRLRACLQKLVGPAKPRASLTGEPI